MTQVLQDNDELQALFDSIVEQRAPEAQAQPQTPAKPTLQAVPAAEPIASSGGDDVSRVIHRVGQLTRVLHDSLRELGYDRLIAQAAASIPDARDRLSYVAMMTEQAATRALNATEVARPIQDELGAEARKLSELWARMHARELTFEQFKALLEDTRSYLGGVPSKTDATNAQLTEIMMAQDFQDLTGQVIKKITDIVQRLEKEMVQLLLDCIPPEKRHEPVAMKKQESTGLLNGPVIAPQPGQDVVTSQNQVDELLESLGF
ncbi:MAG: protein phosphatase CheZ [Rhodospirillaceae bacterium]